MTTADCRLPTKASEPHMEPHTMPHTSGLDGSRRCAALEQVARRAFVWRVFEPVKHVLPCSIYTDSVKRKHCTLRWLRGRAANNCTTSVYQREISTFECARIAARIFFAFCAAWRRIPKENGPHCARL